jgi:hypothetical protein
VCSVHGYKAAGSGMTVQRTMLVVFLEFSVRICYKIFGEKFTKIFQE